MAARVPDMNPIRWVKSAEEPDFQNFWPNDHNMRQREDYYPGINAANYVKDFVQNIQIANQIEVTIASAQKIFVYKLNENTIIWEPYAEVDPVDITPSGYIAGTVYRYDWTGTEEGTYHFIMPEEGIESDVFMIHSRLKFRRRLVDIKYWNSYNDYGMIFDDNGTSVYTGRTFFEGQFIPGDLQNTISGYEGDRGKFVTTRSTPVNTALLRIFKVHFTYQRVINSIFSCDNIFINGIRWNSEEPPSQALIKNSDLANFEVNLKEVNITYSLK